MTSQLSYFHLGQVTVADVRPYMDNTYTIMEVSSGATLICAPLMRTVIKGHLTNQDTSLIRTPH